MPNLVIIMRRCESMKKIMICLLIMLCLVYTVGAHADGVFLRNNAVYHLRGRIVEINPKFNNLTIEDDSDQLERYFYVPFKRIDHLKVGDEVRIYFRPGTNEAYSVQKMTPVEYERSEQNKGYLLKAKDQKRLE